MPTSSPEYRLSPEARDDFEAIWLFTLKEWGLEQANRYTDELTATFARLADSPQLGTPCDHIRLGYRRNRVGRHVIYYRIADYGVIVIRVLHDRMLSTRHL